MINYAFHPEAEEEFLRAIDYYEERGENLGLDFAVEVHAAIARAAEGSFRRVLDKVPNRPPIEGDEV